MLRHPGSCWGFGALLKGTSVVVLRVKRALYIHSPHLKFLPAQDSNSQPFDYEANFQTTRPRLPQLLNGTTGAVGDIKRHHTEHFMNLQYFPVVV